MPLVSDLMGLGVPGPVAQLQGNTPQSITAAATIANNASGTTIPPGSNIVLVTFASTTACAAVLSTAWSLGTPVYVQNVGTVSGAVFAPISGTMNAVASASVTISTARTAMFIQTTAQTWFSIPSTAQ